jgi:urease accessory protein
MKNSNATKIIAAYGLLMLTSGAYAHTGADAGGHHGFLAGLAHPFTGADHMAAMLAVGLWSALVARRAGPSLLWAPLGFMLALWAGAWMGLQGVTVPAVEPMIAASLLVIGLLVAVRLRLPGPLAAAVVGVFAAFHGAAHGMELAGTAQAWPVLAGMLLTTGLLHAAGIAIGWALRRHNAWLARGAGGAIALLGLALLGQWA